MRSKRHRGAHAFDLEVSPAVAAHLHVGIELVSQGRHGQAAPLRRVQHQSQVLRIQSTAKPKLNWSATMVLPRLSICQLWRPLPMTSSTWFMSSPAPGQRQWLRSGPAPDQDANLVDHFGQLPGTAFAQQGEGAENAMATGLTASNAVASPPHITVSKPFCEACLPT